MSKLSIEPNQHVVEEVIYEEQYLSVVAASEEQ
jgi:hypothetical protein